MSIDDAGRSSRRARKGDLHQGPERHEGLLDDPEATRQAVTRRVVQDRGSASSTRRARPHPGPQEGHDHRQRPRLPRRWRPSWRAIRRREAAVVHPGLTTTSASRPSSSCARGPRPTTPSSTAAREARRYKRPATSRSTPETPSRGLKARPARGRAGQARQEGLMERLKGLLRQPLARTAAAALGLPGAWVGGALRPGPVPTGPLVDLDPAVRGSAAAAKRLARRAKGMHVVLDAAQDPPRGPARGGRRPRWTRRPPGREHRRDLARRDFTVNAALPFAPGAALLDPFRGLADAAAGPCVPSARRLRGRPAVRPACLPRPVPPRARAQTVLWAKRHRALLSTCAAERVRTDIMGVLAAADSAAGCGGWMAAACSPR